MITSGEIALATSGDAYITLLQNPNKEEIEQVFIINESGVAGFFSLDLANWARLVPIGGTNVTTFKLTPGIKNFQNVYIKRVQGGSDLTGLFGFVI